MEAGNEASGRIDVTHTRAAILAETGQPLVVDEIELPGRLEVGQVLVEVDVAGLCGSQLGEIDAVKGPDRYLPHLLGHEGVGRVRAVGPGVSSVGVSDRVVLHWRPGAGIEARPAGYRWRGATLNAGWVTTFSRYTVVSENRVTAVADDLAAEAAVVLGCPATTGIGAVVREAGLTLGESLVVVGAGGVGLAALMAGARLTAHPIVAVDRGEPKLSLARELGATHTIDAEREDVGAAIAAVVGDRGADVVLETTGVRALIEAAYAAAAADGRVVLVGVPDREQPASIATLDLHFGKRLVGSHGGDTDPARDIVRYARMSIDGRLPLQRLVTDRVPLADINDAVADLRAGRIAGRCLVEVAG